MPRLRPYMHRTRPTANWQYRRRWAKDVADHLSHIPGLSKTRRTYFTRDLGSGDVATAAGRPWRRADEEYDAEQARMRREAGRTWSHADLEDVAREHYANTAEVLEYRLLDSVELDRVRDRIRAEAPDLWAQIAEPLGWNGDPGRRPVPPRQFFGKLSVAVGELMRLDLKAGRTEQWEEFALEVAAKHGVVLQSGTKAARLFTQLYIRSQMMLGEKAAATLDGDFTFLPTDPVIRAAYDSVGSRRVKRVTVDDLISGYEAEHSQRWDYKAKTKWDFVFRLLREAFGPRADVAMLEREHYVDAFRLLQSVPANASKLPQTRGLSLRKAGDVALNEDLPTLAPKTVRDYWNKVRQLLTWGIHNGKLVRHFADGLKVEDDEDDSELRDPFTAEQLKAIFSTGPYADPTAPRGARFWVPLLALHHGFRLGEACQLTVADLVSVTGREVRPWGSPGVPCLSLAPGDVAPGLPRKRLKNKVSKRLVPVHPAMIELGFLDYVAALRKAGEVRMFPDLAPMRGSYSPRLSRWFARHLELTGLKTDKTAFHSFRHTWRDATRAAQINRELVAAMGGWSLGEGRSRNVMDNYGNGPTAEAMSQAIERVAFPGLDLSHLYLADDNRGGNDIDGDARSAA